jgi:metallo-beta-lactamase family protein
MHQGGSAIERLANEHFQFDPTQIDAVILSHVHIDHSGLLPKLVGGGFNGPIYCTKASSELLGIMLYDSVGLYLRDLEYQNLRRARKGEPAQKAEYTKKEVKQVLKLLKPCPYISVNSLSDNANVTFHDAGHILGSAIVEIKLTEKETSKTLVFSGDLGNTSTALMNDPVYLTQADVVVMEGTYGDRNHRSMGGTLDQLRSILNESWKRGGNIMIPAFAVGRTQELLFYLGQLYKQGELDNWQVILDSPMAIQVTKVYDRWLHTLDCDGIKALSSGDQTLLEDFIPRLHLTVTPEDSMAINRISKGALIIAGSGMCTGGRIRHHFKHRIWDKRNTLIFVGFQARGTLGRILVDGAKRIKIYREEYAVKATIETLGGFSAHAGQDELVEWISHFNNNPRVILVHGEAKALDTLSQRLWKDKKINTEIPEKGSSIVF